MSIVVLQVPEFKYFAIQRPTLYSYCSFETFQRWGGVIKPVRDPHLFEVWVYRCCGCGRTFRFYPQGIDPVNQTLCLRIFARWAGFWGSVIAAWSPFLWDGEPLRERK